MKLRIGGWLSRNTKQPEPWDPAVEADPCRRLEERLRAWRAFGPSLRDWLRGESDLEPCIADGLRRAQAAKDGLWLELYAMAALEYPSRSYTAVLCEVLDERRDDLDNERLVDALDPIADPAAIASLRRAIGWLPEWDEFGQLSRKAVWALARIGTPEALAAIREEVTEDMPFKVVEAAADVLKPPTR